MVKKSPSSDTPPRPRGRPRGFDANEALGAATERFRVRGFAGTSLDDLVDATGLARPSLYAAFGDKKALYLAALDRTVARATKGFDGLIASDLPLRAALAALFDTIVTGYLTGEAGPAGCIMVSTSTTSAVDDPNVRARLDRFVALEDDKVAALLARHQVPGAAAKARIVAAVIHSLSIRARAGAPRAELDAIAADCIDLIAPA